MWIVVFAIINFGWMISFGIIHTNTLSQYGSDYEWRIPLLNEITGTYAAFILIPLLFLFWKKVPLTKSTWLKRLPLYLVVTVLTGILHTIIMLSSRELLYPVFNLGEHNAGRLVYRFTMEFQKQIFWIWGSFGFMALVGHLRTYHENRIQAVKLKEQLVQSRLDVMRQQINPHFLFNSLNLISSKVYENAEEADLLITELADLLRASLEMGKQPTVSLGQELGFLEKYVHIMKERFGDRFIFSKKIESSCLGVEVPSLILQPIIENSFKHRLEADSAGLKIDLTVAAVEGELAIEVLDESSTDIVTSSDNNVNNNGVGLSNVRARLETMYDGNASIDAGPVNSRQFRVKIQLPMSEN
jgi:hypothetical protein